MHMHMHTILTMPALMDEHLHTHIHQIVPC